MSAVADARDDTGRPEPTRSRAGTRTLARVGPHAPLLALLVLAAAVRLSTLGLQSFWYDEAYTPVHVLHPGVGATLRSVVHTENSPPLWYVLEWGVSRLLGTGVVALRLLSAVAGVATVAVAWAIGRELGTRRTAIVLAAIVAVNPLFVWYSQEARDYGLYACLAALSVLGFLRAWQLPTARRLAWWSLASVLALLTHYFAAFLIAPEALLLLGVRYGPLRTRLARLRPNGTSVEAAGPMALLLAVGAVLVCGLALLPLVSAQGAHGTQWIGRWALSNRLVAVPGYFLLGGQSSVFGHALLGLCAAPVVVSLGLLTGLEAPERRTGMLVFGLGAVSLLIPLALLLFGADYLAPRNLIASWVPLSAALAVLLGARRSGRAGVALAALVCLAGLGVVGAIDLAPRYQRGDWHGVAGALASGAPDRAVVTVELGAAPLEYYRPALHYLPPGRIVSVSEVDVVGYRPLRPGARRPPTTAFAFAGQRSIHGLLLYRFTAAAPQRLSERSLRARRMTATRSEVLVPSAVGVGVGRSSAGREVP
jgi:mannosyltransferase